MQNKDKRADDKKGKKKFGEACVVEDIYTARDLLVIPDGDFKLSQDWILNLSCTFHMCSNRDWFLTYETVSIGTMLMGSEITHVRSLELEQFELKCLMGLLGYLVM